MSSEYQYRSLTWTPISEPPDDETTVLVCNMDWEGDSVSMGFIDAGQWRVGESLVFDPPPTHWADLPEAATI